MTVSERIDAPIGASLNADLSAVEIDVRCATVLARIALQTLAEICPEAQGRIQDGLQAAISDARLEAVGGADAVVGLLTEVAAWLRAETERVVYLEA